MKKPDFFTTASTDNCKVKIIDIQYFLTGQLKFTDFEISIKTARKKVRLFHSKNFYLLAHIDIE